jgi:hypothetical protein
LAVGQMVTGFFTKRHFAANNIGRGVGYGLLSAGSVHLAHDIGIIHGLDDLVSGLGMGDDTPRKDYVELPARQVNGISNQKQVSGMSNQEMVSEHPERVNLWHAEGLYR